MKGTINFILAGFLIGVSLSLPYPQWLALVFMGLISFIVGMFLEFDNI